MLRALVLGGAASVMADAEAALAMFRPDAVFAVNNMIVDWPDRLDFACTLHPERTADWPGIEEAIRRRCVIHGRNRPETWGHKPARGIDRFTNDWRGSSGLFAVRVALHEGFTRIVLAGVPMSVQPHYFDRRAWAQAGAFHKGWRQYRAQLLPHVRSMSGWTADFLGKPTIEWLAGTTPEPGAQ